VIGVGCVVGHNAYLEGCAVEDGALVGSMASVLPRARIGEGAVVGAGAVVPPRFVVPAGALAIGVPVRVMPGRATNRDHDAGVQRYVDNARRYRSELRELTPPSVLDGRVE
jgi:carbonic anhydrase/acetyltransferase-like protein (isoleucine patch superfamily)